MFILFATFSIALGLLTVGISLYTVKFLDSFFIKSLFIIFSFSLGAFVIIAGSNLESDTSTDATALDTVSKSNFFSSESSINKKPFTILILGADRESFKENSRSDSMMLAVVNPKTKEVNIMSIFRDLYTYLPDQGQYDKINAAFSYGGYESSVKAVENYFDVSIDHYAVVNFSGFVDLVDSIGGIQVDVEKDIEHNNPKDPNYAIIKEGEQNLNGKEALTYTRFRSDEEGDFGRARRQRQVVQSLSGELLSLKNIKNTKSIYDAINDNFDTSLNLGQIMKLGLNFKDVNSDDIKTFGFEAEPVSYNGISYVEPLDGEIDIINEKIKELLEQ